MQLGLAQTLNRILCIGFVAAVSLSVASFHALANRALGEAEAAAVARTREILNGQIADLTRELRDHRTTVMRLRSEIMLANYRRDGLAIGIYAPDKSPIFESTSLLGLQAMLESPTHSVLDGSRAFVWRRVELGPSTLGYVVFSLVVDMDSKRLVMASLLLSISALIVAIALVFLLSRRAIKRYVEVPLQLIDAELPRLRDIVDGSGKIRSPGREDRDGRTAIINRGVREVTRLRSTLFDFSVRLRHATEAKRRAESELARSSAIHQVARQTGHDIRSPLAALETMLGSSAPLSDDRQRLLRLAVRRIQDIASHLLNLEQCHEPRVVAMPLPFAALREILTDLVDEKRVVTHEIIFETMFADADAGSAQFAIGADEFRRVLANLLDNACEAIQGAGKVTVEMSEGDGGLSVAVNDSGPGVAAAVRERLFKRGVTHGKVGGCGLGLAYVHERVTAWGGTIELVSGPQTRFEIKLPPRGRASSTEGMIAG